MSAATAVLRRFKFSREVVLLGVLIVLLVSIVVYALSFQRKVDAPT